MEAIALTQDQSNAYTTIVNFIIDPDRSVLVLKGYAGTGKSTLVRRVCDDLPSILRTAKLVAGPGAKDWAIQLTATTNKACEALHAVTGADVQTVFSFLGLRVQKDFRTRESQVVINPKVDMPENTIIVIDEAGFLDHHTLQLVFQRANGCKLLFIGDPAQLAPVKSNRCPVFEANFETVMLTEVMRQARGNPIVQLATSFRDAVNDGQFFSFRPDGHHIVAMDRPTFMAAVEKEFNRADWKYNDSKVLAYTNPAVISYNHKIREMVQGEPTLQKGDYAICNRYMASKQCSLKTDQLVCITDIEEAEVYGVPGHYVRLDEKHEAFLPRSQADRKAAIKAAQAEEDFAKVRMIESVWIDLRAAYACTVHKSQGSTYDKVFIDLDDIRKCNSGDQIARMMYVAVSRARSHVYMVGDLV